MTLGERIQKYRKESGLTQRQLSELIGKTFSSVQKYELGLAEPPLNVLQKIADALGVPVSSLLYDGTIHLNLDNVKNPEDMTPEELKEYMSNMPKAFEELKKAMSKTADTILDYHADGDVLLLQYYNKLNHKGRKEAIKRTMELSRQEEYTAPDEPDTSK